MTDYQHDFISNLKKYRQDKKLSQAELAEHCDVTTGTIGNIECGLAKPSFDLILKIPSVLNIHPAMLFATEQFLATLNDSNQNAKEKFFLENLYNELKSFLKTES